MGPHGLRRRGRWCAWPGAPSRDHLPSEAYPHDAARDHPLRAETASSEADSVWYATKGPRWIVRRAELRPVVAVLRASRRRGEKRVHVGPGCSPSRTHGARADATARVGLAGSEARGAGPSRASTPALRRGRPLDSVVAADEALRHALSGLRHRADRRASRSVTPAARRVAAGVPAAAAPRSRPASASVPTAASRSAGAGARRRRRRRRATPLSTMPEGLAREDPRRSAAVAGERKQVTVLFCDLVGSTAIAERPRSGGVPRAARAVRRAGVPRDLPLRGHRQPARRRRPHGALRRADRARGRAAARRARRARASATRWRTSTSAARPSAASSLRARIGINTGPVVVGTVGNDLKMDYTAIGDTTNLAARLESLAQPGTILISEATARLVRGFFRLRDGRSVDGEGQERAGGGVRGARRARRRPARWRSPPSAA